MAPLLVALVLAAGPAEHGRVVLSAGAGGGWASDPFIGAGLGGGPMLDVSPGARLDVSVSPTLKLSAGTDVTYVRFTGADFSAFAGRGGVEARLLRRSLTLSLAVAGEGAEYSRAVPFADLSAAPAVTSTAAALLRPGVRLHAGAFAVDLAATGSWRSSEADAAVAERALALDAGLEWRPGARLAVHASARHERVASARPEFARVATGGDFAISARPVPDPPLELVLRGDVDRVAFDTGIAETLSRVAVELTRPFGRVTAVMALSWTRSYPERVEPGSRQMVYAGVRGRTEALSW